MINKITLLFSLVFLGFTNIVYSQCTNTSSYGAAAVPNDVSVVTISTIQWQTEYNTITGIIAGETYISNYTGGGCITVHSGTFDGPVVAFGNAPLNWVAPSSGTFFIHYTVDCGGCATATTSNTSTIQCASCTVTPVIPAGGIPISTGGTVNACAGTFYDSGGTVEYSPSEDF